MSDTQDYSKLSPTELITEEKKIRKIEITSAVMVGFLAGVMIYGLVKNGFGLIYTIIPLLLIAGIGRNSQIMKKKLKLIRSEISLRAGK